MNIIKQTLATLGLCALLVMLPASTLGGTPILDDERFLSIEETIGKTLGEVEKEVGPPAQKAECSVDTRVEGKPATFVGENWNYKLVWAGGASLLDICFIEGYAVAETRTNIQLTEDDRQLQTVLELVDHRKLRNVLDGEPDRPRWVAPNGPEI